MHNDYLLFGPDSAEDDNYLHMHFIETGAFRKVKNQEKLIIVGRKGSGKSAIYSNLVGNDDVHYIKLLPSRYALEIFQRFIDNYGKSMLSGLTGFAAAWKTVILYEITRKFETKFKTSQSGDIVQTSMNILENWSKSNVQMDNILDFARMKISSLEEGLVPELGSIINISLITDILAKKRVHILIDDLDNVWQSSTLGADYMYGLISCARDLSREHNLTVTIFIREDIFTLLQRKFHQIDNIRQFIEPIVWNPTLLGYMVGKRIQNYFSYPNRDYIDYWNSVFPMDINGYPSFKYMVERTQLRPRELLQYCSLAWDLARSYKKTKVEPKDVSQSESTYSEWKLNDLCSEYSSRYRSNDTLFTAFSGTKQLYSKEDVNDILRSIIEQNSIERYFPDDQSPITELELLYFLYESGFLRARVVENGKSVFKASSSVPNYNLTRVDMFDLHPAFRKTLIG